MLRIFKLLFMRKHFLIQQPPLSHKYRLIVDDINETETFAMTTDIDKVWYNREIVGVSISIMLETHTALSDKGTTALLPIGRYITIWQISKDEKTQRIWFIDYESEISFRELGCQIMNDYFSDNIYNEFEKIQKEMKSLPSNELDTIELVLVD